MSSLTGPAALPDPGRWFASDNNAGAHPSVVEAIAAANVGHAAGYGDDPWTAAAKQRFAELFGAPVGVFFVFGGTGANVLALSCLLRPHQAVICASGAHIDVDETGAPEAITGSKLLVVPSPDGKLRPADVEARLHVLGAIHHAQPRVVSITQSTEVGTRYSVEEIGALCEVAHAHGLAVHLDGARIANAVAADGRGVASLRAMTVEAGVDVVSFGGTKNGMVFGEAVVFLDRSLAVDAPYLHKTVTQLPSKQRFVSAQFLALFHDDLWLRSAGHANAMARLLADEVRAVPGVRLAFEPEANGVFAYLPHRAVAELQRRTFFYPWDEAAGLVRWMCSWDTTADDVRAFAALVAEVCATT